MNSFEFPKPSMKIETERLELHYRHSGDAKLCFDLIEESREHLRPWMPWEEDTQVLTDTEKYFHMTQDLWQKGQMFDYSIFLKDSRTMIGSGGLHSIQWQKRSCDLGYWIGVKYVGNGYATEATKAFEKLARDLGFHRLQIECDPRNKSSRRVAQKLGFILESHSIDEQCHNGRYRDTLRFSKLVNPEVKGYITENFPRGYGLKQVDPTDFKRLKDQISTKAWDDGLTIRDSGPMGYRSPDTKFTDSFKLNFVLFFEDQPVGWFHGVQTKFDTFHMTSSFIKIEHQGKKLYSRILDQVIQECCNKGFHKITSKHSMTHSKIISKKLRNGFVITSTLVDVFAGTLVELTYFNHPLRKKIIDFRCGFTYPDKEVIKVFNLQDTE